MYIKPVLCYSFSRMKNNSFSITLILLGCGLMFAAFGSFIIASSLEILLFWQITYWAGPSGILSFLAGEHLRSKLLKPPPTKQ